MGITQKSPIRHNRAFFMSYFKIKAMEANYLLLFLFLTLAFDKCLSIKVITVALTISRINCMKSLI